MTRAFFLAAAMYCLALPTWPQSALPPAGPYRIAGTVVNAATGAPVPRATVAILTAEGSRTAASVQSGPDGSFMFERLPAAKFQLTVSRRGFGTAFYDQHGDYNSAIVTGKDQDTSHIVFHLAPGAVLRGVVTADGGDPVQGASVLLVRKPGASQAGAAIGEVEPAFTDDTGTYEFYGLQAGSYLLAVRARPWYAMHPARRTAQGNEDSAALDAAYPVTYFDSTTSEASATPIVLTQGSSEEADINLHAVPALRLDVDVQRKPDGSIAPAGLRQIVFGKVVEEETAESTQSGGVSFAGLAPGRYELSQGDPPRVAELDAEASGQVDSSAGVPTVAVAGLLQAPPGAALPGNAIVTLEPLDTAQGQRPLESALMAGGRFNFPAVLPGAWKLHAEAGGTRLPVVAISAGGQAHAGNRITVQDHAVSVAATVSPSSLRVEGLARKAARGFAGAMIVLVPKDLTQIPELARRDQSDSDGSFTLLNVVPGPYTAVAIENGWGLDWSRPAAIARYLSGGVAIDIAATPSQRLRLPEPVPVQSR